MDGRQWRSTIAAAQAGDRRALDELVEGWLPLVYNIVGRALNGHADVDDVVQETMLRAVDNLDTLRDPDSFRSWLVAIAMRQIRDRARRRTADRLDDSDAHAAADFAELTVLRLQLEGQRKEVAEAVRWLDDEDRQLLSLWWLEVAGELTRRELAAAVGISRQHAAVRVQRMKARLETARGIVRALDSSCSDLGRVTARWSGRPDSVWRKRIARHIRGCARCDGHGRPGEVVVPAEHLLVGLALVPVPVGFTLALAFGGKTAVAATAATASVGWSAKVLGALTKPAVAVTAGATFVAGGAYVVTRPPQDRPAQAAPSALSTARAPVVTTPRAPAPSTSPSSSPSPSASATPSATRKADLYGTVVDVADEAPDRDTPPAALPRRPESGLTSSGGPRTVMNHRGDNVTFTGEGYVLVRWQISPQYRPGGLVMPSWTGLKGRLFHVASGGGRRMDDPTSADARTSGMGGPATGYTVLPDGTQQMWQNEYFYLDGTVTLTQNERGADYGITVAPSTWDAVTEDVTYGPDRGAIRYGLVRDNGKDSAPVPQYVTREKPGDAATVAQRSEV
ncbi:sigma-70 family RNA polymerase sigma factor [Streptomyces europaeiscabiei]|uniref:sigma-70 family RNA polymerase sigma factor n=1 Tax=Streptomyces europaeiscabiei TaxID=146819 RepID=UPI0029ABD0E8|nr:sigma-70 family RNA polymerase sigma factor [Streptomyces europaeiscabiei]MDX3846323.1 sigma-70 family RNA polymerase sigma factor [Streptomyces europaeiscabiei]MDX3865613.1 sigma-70 family RNA polymerase sigma factor [Streptomyces europaeiscabiei]MDX3874938.1 sigma-70 family RNA polymerase sigma factor [Streptomyces europaeiscabiei]